MAEPGSLSIGERIKQFRLGGDPPMTQAELAQRADVSVDLISKLEQGRKQTALVTTLHRIARALDVDVSMLLGRPARINLDDGDEEERGVLAIRQAITALWDDGDPAGVEELRSQARYAWACYWTNRFEVLGGLLPAFITTARATAHQAGAAAAHVPLSDAYAVAGSMLVHLGHLDLAYLAMEHAVAAADRSEDELRHAAVRGQMSWLLLHQTGTADGVADAAAPRRSPLAQARRLAIEQADRIEPKLGHATPEHVSVWGRLLVDAAVAAARDGDAEQAVDVLNLADAAATRLGDGPVVRLDYQSPFGKPLVLMQQVDVSVVTDRPGRALKLAEQMPPDADLPLASKARHLADVAYAQTTLGRDRPATDTLLEIERTAPNWMRYQAYPRTIVRELLERERRARTPRLRGLARRLGVA
jgi:transcriptional regulator with XRE-family HTH domain